MPGTSDFGLRTSYLFEVAYWVTGKKVDKDFFQYQNPILETSSYFPT